MAIIKRFNPVLTPKSLLENPQISLSAKGLYAFLQIFEDRERIDLNAMPRVYNIDRELFDASLKELVENDFLLVGTCEDGTLFYQIEQHL
jgi:hypothetical protein